MALGVAAAEAAGELSGWDVDPHFREVPAGSETELLETHTHWELGDSHAGVGAHASRCVPPLRIKDPPTVLSQELDQEFLRITLFQAIEKSAQL